MILCRSHKPSDICGYLFSIQSHWQMATKKCINLYSKYITLSHTQTVLSYLHTHTHIYLVRVKKHTANLHGITPPAHCNCNIHCHEMLKFKLKEVILHLQQTMILELTEISGIQLSHKKINI